MLDILGPTNPAGDFNLQEIAAAQKTTPNIERKD